MSTSSGAPTRYALPTVRGGQVAEDRVEVRLGDAQHQSVAFVDPIERRRVEGVKGVEGPLRIREQAELIDLLPTLLDWSGAPPLEAAQGRSLLPIMRAAEAGGEAPPTRPELERAAFGWWPDPAQLPLRSLVLDDHQLIFNDHAPGMDKLYDLATDPMGQRDLSAEEPALVERLRRLGRAGMLANRSRRGPGEKTESTLDAETLEELRALGYER